LKAFIHETPFLNYHASKQSDCSLKILGHLNQGGYAFSVPKNSMWKHLLSQAVLKLKEQESIDDIYKKWFPAACANNGTGSTEYEAVQINYFGGLIFILTLFLIVSIVLLGGEHFCYRHHRRVINPIQTKVQVWRETKATERRNAIINPDDINYLQHLHQNGMIGVKTSNDESECSSEGDISEGEEELIRMRLGRRNPGARQGTTSPMQRTSLDSLGQYYASTNGRKGSRIDTVSMKKLFSVPPPLHTTLELSEYDTSEVCCDSDAETNDDTSNCDSIQLRDECLSIRSDSDLSKPSTISAFSKNDKIMDIGHSNSKSEENVGVQDYSTKENDCINKLVKEDTIECMTLTIETEASKEITQREGNDSSQKTKSLNLSKNNYVKNICLENGQTDSNKSDENLSDKNKSKVKNEASKGGSLSARPRPLEANTFVRNHTVPLCGKPDYTIINIVGDDQAHRLHNDNDSNYFSANSDNSISDPRSIEDELPKRSNSICNVSSFSDGKSFVERP